MFMYEQAKFYDKCYLLYAMDFSLHQNNKWNKLYEFFDTCHHDLIGARTTSAIYCLVVKLFYDL